MDAWHITVSTMLSLRLEAETAAEARRHAAAMVGRQDCHAQRLDVSLVRKED